MATSIGVLSAQAGMMVSYILPAIFVPSASSSANQTGSNAGSGSGDVHESNVTLKDELVSYAVAQFIICVVSAVIGLLFFRTRPRSNRGTAPMYGGGGSINPTLPEPSLQEEGDLFNNLRLCYSNRQPRSFVLGGGNIGQRNAIETIVKLGSVRKLLRNSASYIRQMAGNLVHRVH